MDSLHSLKMHAFLKKLTFDLIQKAGGKKYYLTIIVNYNIYSGNIRSCLLQSPVNWNTNCVVS